jgi:hypothetical protein
MRILGLCLTLSTVLCAACQQQQAAQHSPDKGGPSDETGTSGPSPTPDETGPAVAPTTGSEPDETTSGEASGSGGGQSTVVAPSGSCGDGVVDPGETCDLGYAVNNDAGECTQDCQLAECGDGHLWSGEEDCDDGPANNGQTYAGCDEYCHLGPHCGDGELQPEHEECDASAPKLEGEAPCDPANCHLNARVTFVTEATFNGKLGGLNAADSACAVAAAAAGLDNATHFKAWLSDGVTGPAQRFVKAAADPNYPYALRNGKLLAGDLEDLVTEGPLVPLDVTEHGETLPLEQYAWTGTAADGQPYPDEHCQKWLSMSYKDLGRVGQVSPPSLSELDLFAWKLDAHWTRWGTRACKTEDAMHLYCFED